MARDLRYQGVDVMHKPSGFLSALGLVVTSSIIAASPASAIPITYTEQTMATGTLGGTPFSATITLTMNNDTTNITGGPSIFTNIGTLTVTVPSFPTATFTDTILAVANQMFIPDNPSAGFGDVTNNTGILFTENNVFSTYDLQTAFGPILGPASGDADVTSYPTTEGLFTLNSPPVNVTFTATTATTAPPEAPEPASLTILGAALAGLGLARRARTM